MLTHKGLRLVEPANANRYPWVAFEVVGTPSVLNTTEVVAKTDITVGNPSDSLILPVGLRERICSSFEGCFVHLYEFLFTKLRVHFPFSDFEVVVIDRLKVAPSQLHPIA